MNVPLSYLRTTLKLEARKPGLLHMLNGICGMSSARLEAETLPSAIEIHEIFVPVSILKYVLWNTVHCIMASTSLARGMLSIAPLFSTHIPAAWTHRFSTATICSR